MKKRRRIILIGIVWLVLVGVLVGLGISRSSDGDSAHEGDRLMTVSGGSAWPEKNDEADAGEADAGENGSEAGTDGTGENSSRENSSGDAGPVSTGKDSPGKESSAGSDTGKKAADPSVHHSLTCILLSVFRFQIIMDRLRQFGIDPFDH